ncbi:hypothetical protein [Methanobrevibacter sp. UBA212]|uniref:hypothetical protein n=1 Tax=Methanobrevibacter sp. UBA212 TaxID=1915476 RepID=UPI0025FB2E0D|nr:hypothetical protein [Methanobrevibacter sp. UBA212]
MKIKHLMLISLMLVILTIGVASASDDVLSDVNLTTTDNEISDEGIVFDDENIGSCDDGEYGDDAVSIEDESIASKDERENAIKIDVHGYDKKMKSWTNTELSKRSYFAEISAPDNATGNVTVFVNGVQCFEKDISDCPVLNDDLYCIGPYDLNYDFGMGKYHVVVLYYGDENYLPNYTSNAIRIVEENYVSQGLDAVDIYIWGYDYDIDDYWEIELGSDDEIAYIDAPDDATGNVTVFVNGVQCFKKDISNLDKNSYGDYCISLKDIDYEFLPRNYQLKIVYDGNRMYSPFSEEDVIRIVDDSLEEFEFIYIYDAVNLLGDDWFASIFAPDDATGNVTVFVNGVQCFKKSIYDCPHDIDDTDLTYRIGPHDVDYEFSPGEYFVKIVYSGDEHWSQIVINKTINVVEEDIIQDGVEIDIYGCGKDDMYWYYAELGSDDWVAVIGAPDNATGDITVFVDGVQCFKKDISNFDRDEYGDCTILLSDLDYDFSLGIYFVEIIYEGDENYSPISESNLIRIVEEGYNDYGPDAVAIVIYGYEDTKLDGEDVFAVIHAHKGITGNVTVFINGTQCFKEDISGRLLDSDDYKDVYRIGPQDVDYNFSPGKYLVKIVYDGDDYYSPASESSIITIMGDNSSNGDANPSGGAASPVTKNTVSGPAVKKDTVKLTLKKVKVKRSAKKLVLQATLKINNKAKKGLKVTFRFNGKKFTAKTNKKGIAKVTIKKKLFKKLKIGKKVKIQVSYGKTTKNMIVKIKK